MDAEHIFWDGVSRVHCFYNCNKAYFNITYIDREYESDFVTTREGADAYADKAFEKWMEGKGTVRLHMNSWTFIRKGDS